jgi:hypothetical protein
MPALRQKSLGLVTRLNVIFSPTMTLQLYAQPFPASGEYFNVGRDSDALLATQPDNILLVKATWWLTR